MIKNLFLLITIFIPIFLLAQEPVYKSYDWGEAPEIPSDSIGEKVNLKDVRIIEFIMEGDYFYEYQIRHSVEFINSEEQVKRNNKKYVPILKNGELVEAKIRVINPDNEIIELDKSKILSAVDENTGEYYIYFALEGMKTGCIIDYYYVLKKYPSYNGDRQFIQDEYLTKDYTFELYSPSHLVFDFKVYNDTNKVVFDTITKDKNHWLLKLKNIEGLENEESSPYYLLIKQLVYKLNENKGNFSKDLTSLGTLSTNIFNFIYSELNKSDVKALEKLIKEIDIPQNSATIDEKIAAIENYIKENINIVSENKEEYSKISSIIKLKSATKTGLIRLFARVLEKEGIEIQLILTGDRTRVIFDEEFESYHYLTDYLFYFPETMKYTAPDLPEYRYGIIPWKFTGTNGLFIKKTSLGDYKTGIGKVKYIPQLGYKETTHDNNTSVKINSDFSKVDLKMTISSTGYYAVYIQPYYNKLNEELKEKIMKDNFDQYYTEAELKSWKAENGGAKFLGQKPFIQSYTAEVTDLIDRAGNKYLFKAGQLIGKQVELYSETERKLPITDNYKRSFKHLLTIEVPEGYYVKNLNDLKISNSYIKDGEKNITFESNYEISGQKITVNIIEYYNQSDFSAEEYEVYRKVINSAADFEKVVLIIEKE